MENQEAVRLLNEDIRGEHGAIILYLHIAYALGEGEMAADLEEIARDEMRHFKWLSEEVVRLGGVPTLEREPMPSERSDPVALMQLTVEREDGAVAQYQAHAEAIGEPRITALLGRIASDERHHGERFRKMIALLGGAPAAPETGPALAAEAVEALQEDTVTEYTTLLQYLHQSFLTPHCPLSKDLQDQAIIEMKHMGWLAEHLAEAGVEPRLEHRPFETSADPEQILQTNVQVELEVEDLYRRQLESVDDPGLRALLGRILDHSVYHETHFRYLLEDVRARQQAAEGGADGAAAAPRRAPARGWTVGSLLGRKQE